MPVLIDAKVVGKVPDTGARREQAVEPQTACGPHRPLALRGEIVIPLDHTQRLFGHFLPIPAIDSIAPDLPQIGVVLIRVSELVEVVGETARALGTLDTGRAVRT